MTAAYATYVDILCCLLIKKEFTLNFLITSSHRLSIASEIKGMYSSNCHICQSWRVVSMPNIYVVKISGPFPNGFAPAIAI